MVVLVVLIHAFVQFQYSQNDILAHNNDPLMVYQLLIVFFCFLPIQRDGLHRSFEKDYDELDSLPESGTTNSLNLWKDYTVSFDNDDSLVMKIEPINPTLSQFGSFKLSCPTSHDLIQWYQVLEQNQCLSTSRRSSETSVNVAASNSSKKRKGRKKVSQFCKAQGLFHFNFFILARFLYNIVMKISVAMLSLLMSYYI